MTDGNPARADAEWIVGVDIGGTNLRVGAIPFAGGAPVEVMHGKTRAREGAGATVRRIGAMVRKVAARLEGEVIGVGVGVPGPLDRKRAMVLETPNLGWRNVRLGSMIAEAAELPVVIDNDAACFALGEWWLGAGRRAQRLVGVTLGTGIGGGIILGGRIYHGASDAAGELGHTIVVMDGRRCGCGRRGCVEAYASGPAIADRAREALGGGVAFAPSVLARGDPAAITARDVCAAAATGDDLARIVVEKAADMLAVAITNVVHLLNPDVVVVGGGVAAAGRFLMDPLRAGVERRAFPSAGGACRIVRAGLPESAGMVGAAAVFKQATGAAL